MFSQPCWRWKQFWPSAFNWSTNKSADLGWHSRNQHGIFPKKWLVNGQERPAESLNHQLPTKYSPRIFHCYPNPLGKWFIFMGQFSWQIVRFSLSTFSIWDQVALLSTNAVLETRLLVHAACETSTVLCTAGWNRRIGVVAERPLV
jgi:hypothetical protein